MKKPFTAVVIVAAIAFSVFAARRWMAQKSEKELFSEWSPDKRYCVRVSQVNMMGIDFNYRIDLRDASISPPLETIVFKTPDEKPFNGIEKIIWSPDSTQFILVGSSFYVRNERLATPSGEDVYLFCDTKTNTIRTNASQSRLQPIRKSDLSAFSNVSLIETSE